MLDEEALIEATHLSKRDVRFVLHDILEGVAVDGDLLVIGLFDLLRTLKHDQMDVTALLRHYREPLRRLGLEYDQSMEAGATRSKLVMMHIINNRYCSLEGEDGVFDLKEMEVVERCPQPFVGMFVVLPELFWRFRRALKGRPSERSPGGGSSALRAAVEGG